MDSTLITTTGKVYHLMPQERWFAERLIARAKRIDSPTGALRRNGYSATVLLLGSVGNAIIGYLLSVVLLIAMYVAANHHPVNATPYIINILIYLILAGPIYFLLLRRRLQSLREARAYRSITPEI